MEPTYYIYSTRAQGWVNVSGTYGTELDKAKVFPATEAFAYCKRVNNAETFPVMMPVETSSAIAAGFAK